MKIQVLPVFLLILAACQSPSTKQAHTEKKSTVDPAIRVSCEGIGEVKLTDSYADLVKKFGRKAVSLHENNVTGTFTSVWNNDPRQINVYWKEKTPPYKTIMYMETVHPQAPYMTNDSIRIGLSLPDLVRRNGSMPLTFNNFYVEEESGLIINYNNGEIPRTDPCFEGKLEWVSQSNIYKDDYDAFKKQKVVESSDRILNRMEVMLGSMRVSAKH